MWARKVKDFHHLVNPKTGIPENQVLQTFVVGDDPVMADAFSTILFLGGRKYLNLLNSKYQAMLILE
jgi:thiamine biosynthesis lipoprotein ApbE